MKGWKIWLLVLILAAVVFAVVYFLFFKKKNDNEVLLYGNIEIRETALSFRVSGRLKELYFEEGDYVKKGQVLARLEKDKAYIDGIIKNNAEKANYFAAKTLRKVQKKVGFPERVR